MEKIVDDLVGQFERGRISRRQLVQMLALGLAAAGSVPRAAGEASHRGFKAVAVQPHLVRRRRLRAHARLLTRTLLGMEVSGDDGKQCYHQDRAGQFPDRAQEPGARRRRRSWTTSATRSRTGTRMQSRRSSAAAA
jgi:hypothetical protein